MSSLRIQFDRIRRGIWLVALIPVIAVVGSVWSASSAGTTYTGRTTLAIGSQYRAPEQDAVLAQGYADLFNEGSYQAKLLGEAGVPSGVVVSARTAAASPILYIEAVGPDREVVTEAASEMSTAFYNDVNASLKADQDSKVAELANNIDLQRRLLFDARPGSQEAILASEAIASFQGRINDIRGDTTNRLQELQRSAGVSSTSPSLVVNAGLGSVGGLIVGVLAALALAALRDRVCTAGEAQERLGVKALAEIGGGRSLADRQEREMRLRRLANLVGPTALPRPAVLAVVAPRRSAGSTTVADAIAACGAGQGERTLLIRTDLHAWPAPDGGTRGVSDALAAPSGVALGPLLQPGVQPDLRVLPTGTADADPYALFAPARLAHLLDQATGLAELVVIEVPPLLEAAEAQAICAAAQQTIVVLDTGVTRSADAREAIAILAQTGSKPFGVVLLERGEAHGAAADPPVVAEPDVPRSPDGRSPDDGSARADGALAADRANGQGAARALRPSPYRRSEQESRTAGTTASR